MPVAGEMPLMERSVTCQPPTRPVNTLMNAKMCSVKCRMTYSQPKTKKKATPSTERGRWRSYTTTVNIA